MHTREGEVTQFENARFETEFGKVREFQPGHALDFEERGFKLGPSSLDLNMGVYTR